MIKNQLTQAHIEIDNQIYYVEFEYYDWDPLPDEIEVFYFAEINNKKDNLLEWFCLDDIINAIKNQL